jgi:IS30 family transposase
VELKFTVEFNFSINAKLIKGNQRHLSLDDRIYIEKALEKSIAFKDIALFLSKDPTTIPRRLKNIV